MVVSVSDSPLCPPSWVYTKIRSVSVVKSVRGKQGAALSTVDSMGISVRDTPLWERTTRLCGFITNHVCVKSPTEVGSESLTLVPAVVGWDCAARRARHKGHALKLTINYFSSN